MTIQLELPAEILKEIHYQRYNYPAPLVQRRMEALWLKGHDLPHGQIAELVGVSENTLREYFELYQQGGLEKLKELHYYRPESELNVHITSLEAHFREHPPASIKEAQSEIEAITGVKRRETQVAEFLKKTAFPLPKSRHAPGESRSAGTGGVSQERDGAASGRGTGWKTRST